MIVTVLGARPQFVKAAVVSRALIEHKITERIIHTGQHYDDKMSSIFWRELGIPPYEINLNVGSGFHGEQTAQMLIKIEGYLLDHRLDVKAVMVYGDTNSTLAGALAASKLEIPVIHIESGLRSFNRSMPEEVNRVLTDHISDLLFCPSNKSVQQLKAEGIQRNVFDVGDVMYDAMLTFSKISDPNILDNYDISLTEGEFNLLTIHRPSNTDNYAHIKQIVNALGKIGSRFIWPLHPRTRKVIAGFKLDIPGNIIMVEPFSYLEILKVLSSCSKVITDSGGMQKEAYWMKKPCITLREETEWTETLANHWNFLAGSDESRITQAIKMNIDPSTWEPLYGDGKASLTIARIIKEFLSN